jgi:hypothetical protein
VVITENFTAFRLSEKIVSVKEFLSENIQMLLRYLHNNKINILFVFITLSLPLHLISQIDFSYRASYTYLKGKDAASINNDWMKPGFDDSGWLTGNAPFRYGDGTWGVELTDMQNNYSTLYMRSEFVCANAATIKELLFTVDYDDGFVIWINGVEILRRNAPESLTYDAFATENHESGLGEEYTVDAVSVNLVEGTNLIAVQGFNVSLSSSDFYFDMAIWAEEDLPEITGDLGINFSVQSGFFSSPFNVVITLNDPTAQIVYTLDGSNPQYSGSSFTVDSPANVLIDPSSNTGRPVTPAVVLRASAGRTGYKSSRPSTRTYIFIEQVKSQSWPGGEWPDENVNGQLIDLEMDSRIVTSPEYSGILENSLLDIPVLSVVTDLKNLFSPVSGIYVNAEGHGINWERDCSVELIQTDGTEGFNVNAGLRIRGGWSRHDNFPKHSFRLFFREKYGVVKLFFPLFGNEGTDYYDKIDLRTEQNYAWSTGSPYNSFVREVFSRDTQRDMGQPYTRSRYYHLYLNGMYWGLYQTQERSEARFASSYMGGDNEDYDVVKVNTENYSYTIEATDGLLDSWQRIWNLCNTGFTSNSNYFKLQGKDPDGKPVKGGEVMVDIDNLIDYMLVIFYTGNFDAPTSSFSNNKGCNNFFAIDNREDKSTGFIFFAHDSEHSLFDEPHNPGTGLNEDRVNLATRTDQMKMELNDFTKFHPQWLHHKLTANSEYRIRFADRAYSHFQPGGVFSPEQSLARINTRIKEVEMAVIAESARWGDARREGGVPYTKNDNWLPEINKIRNKFIPYRNSIVIAQLKEAGLYSLIDAPVINTPDSVITQRDIILTSPVTIELVNPNPYGTIYYTLDNIDPRKTGDGIYNGTLFSTRDIKLTISASSILKSRIYYNGIWSPLKHVNFIKHQEDYSNIKVTELHYHPPDYIVGTDTTSGKDLEFIEFKNTGENAVNLSGLILDSAVHYQFPVKRLLAPGQFFVVASKPSCFYDYYGMIASDNYQGNFSNAGEEVLLTDAAGNKVIHFAYDDSAPWPTAADGNGFSLSSVEINPSGDPANYWYWTQSVKRDGSPFADNTLSDYEDTGLLPEGTLMAYPNPTKGLLTLRLITEEEINQIELLLFNMTGKLLKKATIGNPGMLDLAAYDLPAGIYILKANTQHFSTRLRIILVR